jgi:predicted DNA-binding transcriptional regulator AlpA
MTGRTLPLPLPEECNGNFFLTTKQLVEMLGLASPQTVYSWNRREKGPPNYKFGKELRWKCREVLEWVKAYRADMILAREEALKDELTPRQTATLIGWTLGQLDERMSKRTAPPYKVDGKTIKFSRTELLAWMEENGEGGAVAG